MNQADLSKTARFKAQLRQDWTEGAAGWRQWNAQFVIQSRAATDAIVQAAQVTPGMQVLDLASGTGEPALTLAEAVRPGGHVTATDLVPEMLAITEEFARQRGLRNLTTQPADAEALPFPEQTFDVVTCRFGLMFCPDVGQALREIRRVLKPGGRAAFMAWGPFDQNPYSTTTVGVFMQHVPLPPPEPGTPHPFIFAQAGTLSTALRAAGFAQVQEEARTIPWVFPGPVASCWEAARALSGPAFRRCFEALAPERHAQVIQEVHAAIGHYYDGQQVNFTARIVLASGRR